MRITIGLKIFAIAIGLLALMSFVALLSTRLAREVGGQLDFVIEHYIPGYGALARANVRSVEQALYLRRIVINLLETPQDQASIEKNIQIFTEKGRQTDLELAYTRRQLAEQVKGGGKFTGVVALARLDTRLELMAQDRQHYEKQAQSALAALEKKDYAEFRRQMNSVEALRDDFDYKIDAARHEMLLLAQAAAEDTRHQQAQVITVSLLVMAIAGALGLLVAGAITFGLVRPVRRLLDGAKAVEGGALDTVVPITSRDEIGSLTKAFNQMVAELRVKAQIRETFGKYIDPRIVEGLIDRPELAGAGGERRMMTVSFCDMKGFTSIGEGLTPRGLVNVINQYLTTMSSPIREHNGIIDKYIGDAIMAFWGPPFTSDEDQARLACLAALDQLARLSIFRQELPELMGIKRGLPDINMRIGIATGEVVVGNIGSDIMKSYTVMGDTVNLASRLEGVNKSYGTRILIGEDTAKRTTDTIETREIDSILVVGKIEPQRVFEVLGRKGEVDQTMLALGERFAAGLAAYRQQAWPQAKAEFEACLAVAPDDGPARVFLQRVTYLAEHLPGPAWNGVWSMTEK
ncbi:MAG TPA: adenylate/guanylate cyclase domain-containing protein [Acidobacteriota bacterium]|jgi:adenylate cyclase|nr:adenylate/guanylate cyclase domain-containing protein [Acidobacteriota bacterium]